jgi:hypothetical protein
VLADLFVGAIKFVVVGVYRVFFGWWLSGIQERSVLRRLKGRVRREFGFLFKREGAHFVPNNAIYQADQVVTVAADGVLLRISHHHGEDFVDIAPQHAEREWEPISFALMALVASQTTEDVPAYISFLLLSELAPLLNSRFEELKKAYSPGEYTNTKQVLERIHSFSRYSRTSVLSRKSNVAQAGRILGI